MTITPVVRAATFTDLVRDRANADPDRRAFSFVGRSTDESDLLTRAGLDERARSMAAHLIQRGLTGECVLVLLKPGLPYIAAFLGCLYAGAVAVPLYPPPRTRHSRRHAAVLADAGAAAVIADEDGASIERYLTGAGAPQLILYTDGMPSAADWRRPGIDGDTVAFLQYTSGSTGSPKGVMVTHGNLLANSAQIQRTFGIGLQSRVVSWLPPYHDMGLIGGILQPLYAGCEATLMSPFSFVTDPLLWLRTIAAERAQISGGPNFAYDLCVDRLAEADLAGIDLSSWELAFNGAEPVRAATLDRFAAKMAPHGFRHRAFFPCYGLAEATLLVSGRHTEAPAVRFDADSLAPGSLPTLDDTGLPLVSCGPPADGVTVEIVDPAAGCRRAPGEVGEIRVRGGNVAAGYWNRPDVTAETFGDDPADRQLRTGDLGFLYDGELFVIGRHKDLIVVRGRNHYPSDLEQTATDAHPGIRPGGAAFARAGERGEEVLLVLEASLARGEQTYADWATAVVTALAVEHGLVPGEVVLVRPGSVPRTSSGKVQRSRCRDLLAAGELKVVHRWSAGGHAEPVDAHDGGDPASAVLGIVSEQLGRPVRADVPLLAQGLDSVTALHLRATLAARAGLDIALDQLLGGATVDDLLTATPAAPATLAPAPALLPQTLDGRIPLTSGQRALWYLDRQDSGSAAAKISVALRLRRPVPAETLRAVLDAVVARHPALHTAFGEENGEPFQRVLDHTGADFTVADAAGLDADALTALANERIAGATVDLRAGRPLRAILLTHEDGDVLCLVVHHIVADMWSFAVLAEDLGRLCPPPGGTPETLPLHPAGHGLTRPAAPDEQPWEFWRHTLEGSDLVLELPADRPRPAQQSLAGATTAFRLDDATVHGLQAVAARENTTLYTVLLAAFQVLVHRYTGRDDFVLGTPTSGRTDPATHGTVGYFVNPVLIRSRVNPAEDFRHHLSATAATVRDALAHQRMPFPDLIKRLRPERDSSRAPGYQVLFSLTSPHQLREAGLGVLQTGRGGTRLRVGGLDLESLPVRHETALVDLSMVLTETSGGVEGMINYATALFDESTMRRLAEHFRHLTDELVAHPEAPVGTRRLQSDAELMRLAAWNATSTDYPRDVGLDELFGRWVARTPQAPALVHGDLTLSYRELDRLIAAIAARLTALGAGRGSRVALHADRHPAAVAGMLAIVRAGAAYVPLDPGHPQARHLQIADEAGVSAVVTVAAHDPLPGLGVPVLRLDDLRAVPKAEMPEKIANGPDDLAYVMYTSGSTGVPKGIGITHRNIARLVLGTRYATFQRGERVAQLSNVAFDAATFEIWGALLNGGTLIGLDRDSVLSPPLLATALRRHQVDTAVITTALFNQIAAYDASTLATLRQLVVGGDVIDVQAAIRISALPDGPRLINGYGPTESTTFATAFAVTPESLTGTVRIPIGSPIENTTVHILDAHLEPQPIGVPGQLWIGGDGLGRGYHGRPDLTAERFRPDPFAAEPGARMYATGDRARRLPDGSIDFLGRIDFQVKIRGFRIEPGEIDAALLRHAGVAESATVLFGSGVDKRLVCFYSGDTAPEPAQAAAILRAQLPDYMVPSALVRMDRLPLTPNGKVDRASLPEPVVAGPPASAGERPATALEAEVSAMFAEVLACERVGVTDNFFTLGGHSLLAMRLLSRVRERYGVELAIARLFSDPTVRAVAALITEAGPCATAPPAGPVRLNRSAFVKDAR